MTHITFALPMRSLHILQLVLLIYVRIPECAAVINDCKAGLIPPTAMTTPLRQPKVILYAYPNLTSLNIRLSDRYIIQLHHWRYLIKCEHKFRVNHKVN